MIKGESRGGEKKQQGTGCESESGEDFPHRKPHGKATYPLAQAEKSARPLDFSPLRSVDLESLGATFEARHKRRI
jgi:hypothetical protein